MFAMMLTSDFVSLAVRYGLSLIEAWDHMADMMADRADNSHDVIQCPCKNGDVCMGCDGSGFFL